MTLVDQAVRRKTDPQGAPHDANPETTVERKEEASMPAADDSGRLSGRAVANGGRRDAVAMPVPASVPAGFPAALSAVYNRTVDLPWAGWVR